jgi:F-type H+-transporting ATPase subunit delta
VPSKDELVRGYAEALFRVAAAEVELESVERHLLAFTRLLETEPRMREALTDPSLPLENKRALIAESLGDRANPVAVNMLAFIVEQGRARELARIVEVLAEVVAETREATLAEVRSAVPLDQARTRKLAEALSKATGRRIEVRVVVDPNVMGGVVAKVGDEIFDGSIRTRLDEAREHLADTTTRSE